MVENHEAELFTYGKLLLKKKETILGGFKNCIRHGGTCKDYDGESLVFMEQSKEWTQVANG